MGKPKHIAVIVKEVVFDLINKQIHRPSQLSGKQLLSNLRTEIQKRGIRRGKAIQQHRSYERKVGNG